MTRSIMLSIATLFLGCATVRETLTFPITEIGVSNSPNSTNDLKAPPAEHNLSVAQAWFSVLTSYRTGEIYTGMLLTYARPDKGLSFHLMGASSRPFVGSPIISSAELPEPLNSLVPIKNIARWKVTKSLTDYIVAPAITLDILNFKLEFGFKNGPQFVSHARLQSGAGFDLYLHTLQYDISFTLFDGDQNNAGVPGFFASGYASSLTTFSVDISLFRYLALFFKAGLILNTYECKAVLGLGVTFML